MNKLTFTDAAFLYAETPSTPMNIAAVQHLELPPGREATYFDDLKAYIESRAELITFMTRKLADTPYGLDHPVWVKDPDFDVDNHVKRTRLPEPGTPDILERVVARLHETPLDRSRPLWQYWLIEGLESGHVAWYTKYHHACIDGMAGQAIMDILFTDRPEIPPAPPSVSANPADAPSALDLLWEAARNTTAQSVHLARQFPEMTQAAWNLGRRAAAGNLGALAQRAPRTRFNGLVGPYRTVAFGSLPLGAVKALGRTRHCKANDVFMAVCAGAIARYLDERGEAPDRPLIAGAPISLREVGDQTMSNQVSMLLTSLETTTPDPLERMCAIRESTRLGKEVVADLAGAMVPELSLPGLPLTFRNTVALWERLRLPDVMPPPLNLVISNVPGPRRPMYLNGARLLTHYPVSIPAHGCAVNITLQSYQDRMDFSITACLDALPDADRLRDLIIGAWNELQQAAGDGPCADIVPVDPVDEPQMERSRQAKEGIQVA